MQEKNTYTVLLFGIAREIVGEVRMTLSPEELGSVRALKESLINDYPALRDLAEVRFAVNNEYVGDEKEIGEGDEVAVIPPVSGG